MFEFIIDNDSVFIQTEDKIKKHFSFTNTKGKYLIVLDFYANRFIRHSEKDIQSQSVSNIKMPAATDALNDSVWFFIGMWIEVSAFSTISFETPFASLPMTRHMG